MAPTGNFCTRWRLETNERTKMTDQDRDNAMDLARVRMAQSILRDCRFQRAGRQPTYVFLAHWERELQAKVIDLDRPVDPSDNVRILSRLPDE